MVTFFGFFDALQVFMQFFLGGKGRAIDTLEHRVVFVPMEIGPGNGQQLEGPDLTGMLDMRTTAEVAEIAAGIESNRLFVFDVGQPLQFKGLIAGFEFCFGIGAGKFFPHERQLFVADALHGFFDGLEVIRSQAAGQVKVIIEAIFGGRPDIEFSFGEKSC